MHIFRLSKGMVKGLQSYNSITSLGSTRRELIYHTSENSGNILLADRRKGAIRKDEVVQQSAAVKDENK